MARCPFANQTVKGRSPGPFNSGPWKIVLHTTEGSTAAGAFAAYRSKRVWPHFTVEESRIWQHIDTGVSASAILNRAGGVETNRSHAIQIELVAFAGLRKDPETLASTARLGRWIEETHGVARRWPAGRPQWQGAAHNRSRSLWTTQGGWYGHSQVPENTHWDPGYLSDEELETLMAERAVILEINGTPQPTVKCKIEQGNTWVDLSDYCAYADYARPTFDPARNTVSMSTEKQIE